MIGHDSVNWIVNYSTINILCSGCARIQVVNEPIEIVQHLLPASLLRWFCLIHFERILRNTRTKLQACNSSITVRELNRTNIMDVLGTLSST